MRIRWWHALLSLCSAIILQAAAYADGPAVPPSLDGDFTLVYSAVRTRFPTGEGATSHGKSKVIGQYTVTLSSKNKKLLFLVDDVKSRNAKVALYDGVRTYYGYTTDTTLSVRNALKYPEFSDLPYPGTNLAYFSLFRPAATDSQHSTGSRDELRLTGEMMKTDCFNPSNSSPVYLPGAVAHVSTAGGTPRLLDCALFTGSLPIEDWRFSDHVPLQGRMVAKEITKRLYLMPSRPEPKWTYPLAEETQFHLLRLSPSALPASSFDLGSYWKQGVGVDDTSGAHRVTLYYLPRDGSLETQLERTRLLDEAKRHPSGSDRTGSGLMLLVAMILVFFGWQVLRKGRRTQAQ